MDWELSSRHLLCGVAPIIALLAVYFIFFTFEREKTDVWSYCHFLCVLLLFDRNIDDDGDLVYVSF